jgi:hypothetical protein
MKCRWLLVFLLLLSLGCGGGGSGTGGLPGGITVSILPGSDTLFQGCSALFRASVAGSANRAVTWSAVGGVITQSGVYRAPASTGSFKVRAISQADPTKFAEANITVIPATGIIVTVTPASPTVAPGGTQQFTADVVGAAPGVTWYAANGSITSGGLYTAPNGNGTDTVIARSTSNPAATGRVDITVGTAGVQVNITPLNPSLCIRETVQMSAQVSNATNTSVNWSATGGTIDANGLYTAPSAPGNYDIRATSVQDPTKFAVTQVEVKPIIITVTPQSLLVAADDVVKFSAVVTGPSNTAVTWSASSGSISQDGYYIAPSSVGTYAVTATSVSDPLVSATALVEVAVPVEITTWAFDLPPPAPPWRLGLWWEGHGRKIILGNDVALALDNLPFHRGLRVTYDFYASGQWSNGPTTLQVVGGYKHTSLGFSNVAGVNQSYPNGGLNPPQTGALEVNVLNQPEGTSDARYRLHAPLVHTGPSGIIEWQDPPAHLDFWLDNVTIEYFP